MSFNRAGFAQAAKSMGYTDDEINAIATMKESQSQDATFNPSGNQQQDYLTAINSGGKIDPNQVKTYYNTTPNSPKVESPEEKQVREFNYWKQQEDYRNKITQEKEERATKKTQLNDIYKKTQQEEEVKAPIKGLVTLMGELKTGAQDVGIGDVIPNIIGVSSTMQQFEQKKKLAGQFLAKLVEKNRISDKDREFYQNQIMNISPIGFQGPKEDQMNALMRDIVTLSGYDYKEFGIPEPKSKNKGQSLPNIGTVPMMGPDGKKYNVPSNQVDTFIKDGGKRL